MDVLLSEYLFSLLCMILNIAGSPIPFHKVPPTTGSCIWPMLPKILDHIAELDVLLKVIYPVPKRFTPSHHGGSEKEMATHSSILA